jgi:hypothetical protein
MVLLTNYYFMDVLMGYHRNKRYNMMKLKIKI